MAKKISKELNNLLFFYEEVLKSKDFKFNTYTEYVKEIKNEFKEICNSVNNIESIETLLWKNLNNDKEEKQIIFWLKKISSLALRLYCERTKEELENVIEEGIELMKRKNADYAGKDDFFKNFRSVEDYKITSVQRWFLVRINDKISRIDTLIWENWKEVKNKVQDEKIEDTLKDLSNYATLLFSYIKNK